MSKLILSYLFKTNLASFRSAIINDDTERICRTLDVERDFLNKNIDSEGNTALLLAIEYASSLTVRLLLEQGAHADQPNTITFQTPLGAIASKVYEDYDSHNAKRTYEMAKILLDHRAYVDKPSPRNYRDENDKDYSGKETPLMIAVRKRNLPMVKLLIERKANVNYVERQSQIRAIHLAITNGDEIIFDLLENAGALCRSIKTVGENNLLHWFCYKKENDEHISLLEKLIEKECDINAQNWNQSTPLMIAVKDDMINTSRILLNAHAKIDAVDCNGNKAIDLAKSGSECSLLLRPVTKKQSENSPSIATPNTVLWRKRVDVKRRFTTELSDLHNNVSNSPYIASIYSEEGETTEEQKNESSVYPDRRRDSDEMDTKYERMREKLLRARQKRRAAKTLSQQRAYSVDTRGRAPT